MLIQDRNRSKRIKWSLFSSERLVETVHKARDMGWADKKVQVRVEEDNFTGVQTYIIEPFEKECSCPSILKYADYFIPENDTLLPDTD